jgi:uncharacterized membrane protein
MTMARVEASVVIDRPLEEVFDFASNTENDPQWASGILEARKTSEGPIGVGTTFRGVIERLGQRIEWTSEITHYQPHTRVDFKSGGGPMKFEETMVFEPVEGGTRISAVSKGEAEGVLKVAEPMLMRLWKTQMEASMVVLKGILEARA